MASTVNSVGVTYGQYIQPPVAAKFKAGQPKNLDIQGSHLKDAPNIQIFVGLVPNEINWRILYMRLDSFLFERDC